MSYKTAEKKDIRLKIAFGALSGGGKTYSSLLLAKGLIGDIKKVAIAQTEAGRAQCYVDQMGPFGIKELSQPFTPESIVSAISEAEKAGFRVLILDSLTDEWIWCLEEIDRLAPMAKGNKFVCWAKVTPKHVAMYTAIKASKMHIIGTYKKKADVVLEKNEDGKMAPKKVGLKDIAREDTEYEWMLKFDLDRDNKAVVDKDNLGLFKGRTPFVITEETGKELRNWCLKGVKDVN